MSDTHVKNKSTIQIKKKSKIRFVEPCSSPYNQPQQHHCMVPLSIHSNYYYFFLSTN